MDIGGILLWGLVIAAVIAVVIHSSIAARKRREALFLLATRLGFSFSLSEDYSLPDRFNFLNAMERGENRYAFNVLHGHYQGHDVLAFDYHYETHSSDSKGRRQTQHHYSSFFVLNLTMAFPELTIAAEGFFSKVAQAFGYNDIDFESAEFSRAFCVRSKDKKFAYDVCHAQMMEYLLANRDLAIEFDLNVVAFAFDQCLEVAQIEPNLQRLVKIRSLLPQYLFTNS